MRPPAVSRRRLFRAVGAHHDAPARAGEKAKGKTVRRTHTTLRIRLTVFVWASFFCRATAKVAPALSLRTSAHTGVAIRFLSPSNAAGRSRIRLATKGRPYGMGPSVGARRTAVPVAPTIGRRNPRRAAEQCSALRGADAYSAGDQRSPLRERFAFLRPHSEIRTPNSASVSLFRSLRRSMPSWS